ncbi:MAG: hypothetical protein A3F09_02165 [Chlamydiae bacterium RIFCSPHIGHO2_12_FULL_49_11]|nr:MAG: hypothetical protein A3F09_02165 [Chlamydiae bacterium RIFCSPHIGHO2_12_FULL_49_11]
MSGSVAISKVPSAFIWRRLHSLMGFSFLLFLIEHLFTNSQAALFFGGGGTWFVSSVNFLRDLPYLHVIEVALLGIPIAYHGVLGLLYTFGGTYNNLSFSRIHPALSTTRNWAYSFQRWTAWILFVGIVLHVVQMRFLDYPYKYIEGSKAYYYCKLKTDPELEKTAAQLGVTLYNDHEIRRAPASLFAGLHSRTLDKGEVMARSPSFGAIELLNVRQAFQSVVMAILYTVFVLAAVFHGFNGLWTFLITWGLILSRKAQSQSVYVCYGFLFLLLFLGLMSIWGTFILS